MEACNGGCCGQGDKKKSGGSCRPRYLDKASKQQQKEHNEARRKTSSGWQSRFSSGAAVSLTVLEVKRLLILTLEILVNSRAIRFAGALIPVLLGIVDFGLGFPVAISIVYAIRKQNSHESCVVKKCKTFSRLSLILVLCVFLNAATLTLFALKLNLGMDSLADCFKSSMSLYANNVTTKVDLDELQLDLECCGCSSYTDWFKVDWQGTSALEAMLVAADGREYEDDLIASAQDKKSVPFSCCDRHTLFSCAHFQMKKDDEKTINTRGCASILQKIILKISIVGTAMTGIILFNQIAMIIFLIRLCRKILPEKNYNSVGTNGDTDLLINSVNAYSGPEDGGCRSDCPGIRANRKDKTLEANIQKSKKLALQKPQRVTKICRKINSPKDGCQPDCPGRINHDNRAYRPLQKNNNSPPPDRPARNFYQDDDHNGHPDDFKLRSFLDENDIPRGCPEAMYFDEIPRDDGTSCDSSQEESNSAYSLGTTWSSEAPSSTPRHEHPRRPC